MIDVIHAGHVPVLTTATATLLTSGLLTATSSAPLALLMWALALVGAVVQFLTADRLTSAASLTASVLALLGTAALWGALDAGPARFLAGVATVLFLALAVGATLARASHPRVWPH